jgi:hypothetical protein
VVINYGKDGGKEAGTSKLTIIAPFAPREILE